MKVYVWMKRGAFLVSVASSLSDARLTLANRLGRPGWAQLKKWNVGLDTWEYELLASKPTVVLRTTHVGEAVVDVDEERWRPGKRARNLSVVFGGDA